MNNMEIVW